MKLKFRKQTSPREIARQTKKIRIRKVVKGTAERPRLCVFRSGRHMYAQIINDEKGSTLAATSSLSLDASKSGKELAVLVGEEIAKLAKNNKITNVVFDRNGYIFHGRVQALAEGARKAGLNF